MQLLCRAYKGTTNIRLLLNSAKYFLRKACLNKVIQRYKIYSRILEILRR